MDTVYIFVGDGMGVPGLPHRVTKKEAEALGVADILSDAIANGNYRPEQNIQPQPEPMAAFNPVEFVIKEK